MRKAKWTITLTLALIVAMSAAAFAQVPVAPMQVPLNPTKIPQFAQSLPLLNLAGNTDVPVALAFDLNTGVANPIDLSICEFQTQILPANTLGKNTPAPNTWVWGYLVGANGCTVPVPPANKGTRSYLGPVVVAKRHTPTEMNFYNRLPDASTGLNKSRVMAYTTSTDQTLIWGDPLSLDQANNNWRINGSLYWPGPVANPNPPLDELTPEYNECWLQAQNFVPPALPPACNNNYGFFALQPTNLTYSSPVPAAVHIHGGEVPSVLDGGPDAWWTANGIYGHGYYSKFGETDATYEGAGDTRFGMATYVYPNGQDAAPIWFHDHMLGATRLNVYAGIAGGYVLIDPDTPLAAGLHPLGLTDTVTNANPLTDSTLMTVPLIIQDRMFDTTGQLYFPNIGINPEHPYWVPEFVGDTIVVNGKAWPNFVVEPKRYRFIFLNGSNARSYELFLMNRTTGARGPALWVIGNDQGYLDTPQVINPAANLGPAGKLVMMPGERYEVIIDFTGYVGQNLILTNTAPTPYPHGGKVNANTTGRIMQFQVAGTATNASTYNPATLTPIRSNLVRLTTPLGTTPAVIPGSNPPAPVQIDKVRRLTLNEVIGAGGPLEVLVNNTLYDGTLPKGQVFGDPPTFRADFKAIPSQWNVSYYSELPYEGETELWEIVNITADAHPMHPHLVAFQILNRQALDPKAYTAAYNAAYVAAGLVDPVTGLPLEGAGPPYNYNNSQDPLDPNPNPLCSPTPPDRGDINYRVDPLTGVAPCVLGGNPDPAAALALIGLPLAPSPQEIGWKDTVMVPPNMVTRILVRFGKADILAGTSPDAVGYDFSPNDGHGYVWHCHIVDHEDNEMMRPFTVADGPYPITFVKGEDY